MKTRAHLANESEELRVDMLSMTRLVWQVQMTVLDLEAVTVKINSLNNFIQIATRIMYSLLILAYFHFVLLIIFSDIRLQITARTIRTSLQKKAHLVARLTKWKLNANMT